MNIEPNGEVTFTVRSKGNFGKSSGTVVLDKQCITKLVESLQFEVLGKNGAGG